MITTEFYEGQGLGNQLWSYASLVAVARKLDFDFGFQSVDKFKGIGLFNLNFGRKVYGRASQQPGIKLNSATRYWFKEKTVHHDIDGSDVSPLDRRIFEIKDRTKIDGYFQSEDLIISIKEELSNALQTPNFHEKNANRCVISLRGGEYVFYPTLFLGYKYYEQAIKHMCSVNPQMEFVVVTDDLKLAKEFFPELPTLSIPSSNFDHKGREIFDQKKAAIDFGLIQSASYLILSNSSFSWWGAWTNQVCKFVIAPKYWARHNAADGQWSLGDSLTREWFWQDKYGKLFSYEECLREKETST